MGAWARVRRCTQEADDPTVPEWPEFDQCEHCGANVWSAIRRDGEIVLLDPQPVETELVGTLVDGKWRVRARGHYRRLSSASDSTMWALRRFEAWSMPEALRTSTYGETDDEHEGKHWTWYTDRVTLRPEVDPLVFNEHLLVCRGITEKSLLAWAFSEDRYGSHRSPAAVVSARHVPLLSEIAAESVRRPTAEQISLFG